jgi:hypothetical protein
MLERNRHLRKLGKLSLAAVHSAALQVWGSPSGTPYPPPPHRKLHISDAASPSNVTKLRKEITRDAIHESKCRKAYAVIGLPLPHLGLHLHLFAPLPLPLPLPKCL